MPKTPVEQPVKLNFNGSPTRLRDIPCADHGQVGEGEEFLIKLIRSTYPNNEYQAIRSELARRGLGIDGIIQVVREHPEWNIDTNFLQQI